MRPPGGPRWPPTIGAASSNPPSSRRATRPHAVRRPETGSTVAARLLADCETAASRFTKVLPRDYARVLEAKALAETEGLDEATTTTRMMEAANG